MDTNVLREIVLNNHNIGKNFFQMFFLESKNNIPCFSLYNVIEIRPYKKIYRKFINFFSKIPCLLFFPYKLIVEQEHNSLINNKLMEVDNTICYALLPKPLCRKGNARKFFKTIFNNKLNSIIKNDLDNFDSLASLWQSQRGPKPLSTKQYFASLEYRSIIGFFEEQGFHVDRKEMKKMAGSRVLAYSQFYRVHQTRKEITKNDVMDIMISCATPYVDVIITEKSQAQALLNAKGYIDELNKVKIMKLSELK